MTSPQQGKPRGARKRPAPPPEPAGAGLLAYAPDDNGNAEAVTYLYGDQFLHCPAYGWLRWTGTHWQQCEADEVSRKVIEVLKARQHLAVDGNRQDILRSASPSARAVNGARDLFRVYVPAAVEDFDKDPYLLNCRNGVVDLRTGELTPHDRTQRHTYCVPVDYDEQADDSEWRAFVLDAVGRDEELAAFTQEAVGYSLTGDTREEVLFYLHGPPRSGKGTFTETLTTLLPSPVSASPDFNSFTAKREADSQNFDLAPLRPARLIVASESNKWQSLNPAKVKSLTGGDMITAAFKHKDMFRFRPQFKVWLVSNELVNADADDDAMWARVLVIHFPHSHVGSEEKDKKTRMKSPDNLRAVLRWGVEGAMRWHARGQLAAPAVVTAATKRHREERDLFGQWIAECCTLAPDRTATPAELMASYKDWAITNNYKPQSQNFLAEALKRRGCVREKGTHGVRSYSGIALGASVADELVTLTPEPEPEPEQQPLPREPIPIRPASRPCIDGRRCACGEVMHVFTADSSIRCPTCSPPGQEKAALAQAGATGGKIQQQKS